MNSTGVNRIAARAGRAAWVCLAVFLALSQDVAMGLTLRVTSETEADSKVYVARATVKVFLPGSPPGIPPWKEKSDIGRAEQIDVPVGYDVEISAPRRVFKDLAGNDITDSVSADPDLIKNRAEERFTAVGISVNDQPQTGDPTFFRFRMNEDKEVVVKWSHEYALTIDHDFTDTRSPVVGDESPWAGPLEAYASGNPDPLAQKHWVTRGDTRVALIDGSLLDNSHPGLKIRYVPRAYLAAGPPNRNTTEGDDADARSGGDDLTEESFPFTVGQSPPQRQQIPEFTMYGPGKITYEWQIQFGVEVHADDLSRSALPRVFLVDDRGKDWEVGSGEGTFWFDPSVRVKVAVPARVPGDEGVAATGWTDGDGHYFSASGDIDTESGLLMEGGPARENGSPVAVWRPELELNSATGKTYDRTYRGLEVFQLRRALKVLWQFGDRELRVNATIGEYVFQGDAENLAIYTTEPDLISQKLVTGARTEVSDAEMVVWDATAARLYPLVPGCFQADWRPDPLEDVTVNVIVTVSYPEPCHYPHIAGSPAVQLDPDPDDAFVFKEIKYPEADASVDAAGAFTASEPGKTVLLFGELQKVGRGEPREFLQVRVVDTRLWDDPERKHANRTVIVGRKIEDPALDRAGLGTGYIVFEQARYNPLVYDAAKLESIEARAVYDMEALRSTQAEKIVTGRDALPGPVIPVNLHPGAAPQDRIVVAWYDDPAENDELLWPARTRTYFPRWPRNAAEGLGRIVIASQFGSESAAADGSDQVVAPAVTNVASDGEGVPTTNIFPTATTYDPSRLQQVQIYSQPAEDAPGYNPNEEHALIAPSLRYADVSPRPPAAYALRANDLNVYDRENTGFTESGESEDAYTSHPFVLVQFYDVADGEFKMRVYRVEKEDLAISIPNYRFAFTNRLKSSTAVRVLLDEPHVTMGAGEPVIPFYPLGVVIGASFPEEIHGRNLKGQETYWEDWRGSSWAISGGADAWFTHSLYYPLAPDFWWPDDVDLPPIGFAWRWGGPWFVPRLVPVYGAGGARPPGVGDPVSFLPLDVDRTPTPGNLHYYLPIEILYRSEWPDIVPVLKAGETLTFAGGEHRTDNPTMTVVEDGEIRTVETPGLPGVLAFATAEVVFDSLNPFAAPNGWTNLWTARIGQVLDVRRVPLDTSDFPTELEPATQKTRVKQGKYVFTDLPASLQKRVRYDPIGQTLEIRGLLNDKNIGDATLTASPPAVYVLEPNIMTRDDWVALRLLDEGSSSAWDEAVDALYALTRNPNGLTGGDGLYLVGLDGEHTATSAPVRAFGPGLALLPNPEFLDPTADVPDVSWVTVVENNDPSLGGSPITPHIIKVDRRERYRGAIKTIESDNVFDENLVLRHTGDFGANADALYFEWWYRPDDGSLNVPPPDLIPSGQTNPWKIFGDPSGRRGRGRYEITLKGNPNAPETLIADTWWFVRYRHRNDVVADTDWEEPQPDGADRVNFTWAGAGNSDPFNDFDADGFPDFRAQLAMGWIKRVLDAVNPYEARIRAFDGESPATISSMISEFGARFEGPVALNPDKNVIENVGLIELYETILKRGRDLTIDLSRPVSTPAVANALQLASTRICDFYTLLGNEAYTDAIDPTIGFGSKSVEYGSLAPAVFTFQNQMSSLIEEELALLRGVDDYFARPVYNRLFWNFTKGEGEAAYAMNYNVSDVNADGFIDEDDAMVLYPQGHGDAWGHYLTAVRNQYDLLRHSYFNWVSRSEFYNLMDVVIKVDFLDERKFAQTAAAKAKTAAEIVDLTYRKRYIEEPKSQWQGYTDSLKDRSWGVQGWARRTAQGAYFDWVTANALLPSEHPNQTLEGIQKVDRANNADIAVISANLNVIQKTFDEANNGYNPLGLSGDVVPFDLNPAKIENIRLGRTHFEQIYDRAVEALKNASAVWDNANKARNMLRKIANTEAAYRNAVFQENLSYRNRLIKIFGKPYEGTIGPGQLYPAGYDGPDLALYMYVDVRDITDETVPGPSTSFATFSTNGYLSGGDLSGAFSLGEGGEPLSGDPEDHRYADNKVLRDYSEHYAYLFAPTFFQEEGTVPARARDGWYSVNYTDLTDPKVDLTNYEQIMPVTAAGYTFQAPEEWGSRLAVGELQTLINQMIRQEAEVARAIAAWDALTGEIVRTIRVINLRFQTGSTTWQRTTDFARAKYVITNVMKGFFGLREIVKNTGDIASSVVDVAIEAIPQNLPTVGLAVSLGDALAPARAAGVSGKTTIKAGFKTWESTLKILELLAQISLDVAETEVNFANATDNARKNKLEWLKGLEDLAGDEAIKRIEIFKQIRALAELSDRYRAKVDEGARLIDQRTAYNKRVAAQTQRNRYQDMTFRVARNHALETYRSSFDLAARYAYLAAKAYDYETSLGASDPASPAGEFSNIVKARGLGQVSGGVPLMGKGGLAESLARLKLNYTTLRGQLGLNNPQAETGKISLRTELFRIKPTGSGVENDALWRETMRSAQVEDLRRVPEFRHYCRPFASDAAGAQPGIVLRFGTEIMAGRNFFGRPLSGADHAYDPSHFATRVLGVGVWFSDYHSEDVANDLPSAPRVYLIPAGNDAMRASTGDDPDEIRFWNVVDQRIPVPMPAVESELDTCDWIPLMDSLDGRLGDPRKFPALRAYHDGSAVIDVGEMEFDTRLIGRSVWNTEWLLIVPGAMLNEDPGVGIDRFVEQVTDIKLVFQTYGYAGN